MLSIEKLYKQYGPQKIVEDAEFFIGPGERIGLVGPNGAGKTTIFRMIMGQEEHDAGTIRLDDWASVDMLSQESQCTLGITVREEMMSAFKEANEAQESIDALTATLESAEGSAQRAALRELTQAQTALEMQDTHTAQARVGRVLKGLGFADDALGRLTDTYSGGWQMRIAMAKMLLREPDLLLLDEPTNHLDTAARLWLQSYLDDYPGAVLLISHEPKFLDAICTSIVELDEYKLESYTGNYSNFQRVKHERREAQLAAYERQQREIERQMVFIDRFGAKATKATQVKSREKQMAKVELIEAPRNERKAMYLSFPEAPKAALDALRLKHISKSYDDAVVLLDINMRVHRTDRIALMGPNGAGKSTLLRILAGIEQPSEGEREEGRNLQIGYFAQHQAEALDLDRTAMEEVLHGLELQPEGVARGILGRLQIRGDEVFKPIRVLSGGERSRVALAKFLMKPANVLMLDEPTNHLDPASRAALQEALSTFEGAIVVVSHDAPFVASIAKDAFTLENGVLIEQRTSLQPSKGHKKK